MTASTFKATINEACKSHDIYDVLSLSSKKKTFVCPLPFHNHSSFTPSFSVFWNKGRQWWRCHGSCGLEGDVVDLVGFLFVSGYQKNNAEMQSKALTLLDQRYEFKMPTREKHEVLEGLDWMSFTPPGEEVIAYAKTRGLSKTTLEKFNIGQHKNFMTIPTFEEGRLRGIKMRRINQGSPRFIQQKGSSAALFNHDAVKHTTKPVLFVKGEIPVMLLDQLGFLACAPTAGEAIWRDEWKSILVFASKKIVIGDNDEAGIKGASMRAEKLNAELKFPPQEYKDIDEWINKDSQAVQTIQSWLASSKTTASLR